MSFQPEDLEGTHDNHDSSRGDSLRDGARDQPGVESHDRKLSTDPHQASRDVQHGDAGLGIGGALDARSDGSGEANAAALRQFSITHAQTYAGPLPAPADFAAYDQALPGAADRILAMAEKDQGSLILTRAGQVEDNHVATRAEASALKVTVYGFAALPYVLSFLSAGLAMLNKDGAAIGMLAGAALAALPQAINAIRRNSSAE